MTALQSTPFASMHDGNTSLDVDGDLVLSREVGVDDYLHLYATFPVRELALLAIVIILGSVGIALRVLEDALPLWGAMMSTGPEVAWDVLQENAGSLFLFVLWILIMSWLSLRAGRYMAIYRGYPGPRRMVRGLEVGRWDVFLSGPLVAVRTPKSFERYDIRDSPLAQLRGRSVQVPLGDGRLLFLPVGDASQGRALRDKVREGQGQSGRTLPGPEGDGWSAHTVSIDTVRAARAALAERLSLPRQVGLVGMLWTVPLGGLTAASLRAAETSYDRILPGVLLIAIIWWCARHVRAHMRAPYGIMPGRKAGPVHVRATRQGVEALWEKEQFSLPFCAMERVWRIGELLAIELKSENVHMVPEPQGFAQARTAAARASDPWAQAPSEPEVLAPLTPRGFRRSTLFGLLFWIALFGLVIWGSVAKGEVLPVHPQPSWVKEQSFQPWDAIADPGHRSPWLLDDMQQRAEGEETHRYLRLVNAAPDRSRLDWAGRIEISLDPSSETLYLHHIRIHRDGAILDRRDTFFTPQRREDRLPDGVIDGRLTWYGTVSDLRVGDLLDVAWSIRERRHVMPGEVFARFSDDWAGEGEVMHRRFILPEGAEPVISDIAPRPMRRNVAGGPELVWRVIGAEYDPEAEPTVETVHWDPTLDSATFSTVTEWRDIREWFGDAYAPRPEALPPALQARLSAIAERHATDEARVTAALRLVQDRVRYLSLSIGAGGWFPRDPEAVWAAGFGDCKDKALLLISLLSALEIEADAVLVNSYAGPALARWLPSPFAFDHVIVRVRDSDGDWFVDPTDVMQGGVGRGIWVGDFGWGLPMTGPDEDLVAIVRDVRTYGSHETVETFDFDAPEGMAATLTLELINGGVEADHMRYRWEGEDFQEHARAWEEWYDGRYPGITLTEPGRIEDDLDTNTLRMVMRFDIPSAAFHERELWSRFNLRGFAVEGELIEFEDDDRWSGRTDIGNIRSYRHNVVFENLLSELEPPTPELFSNDYLRYELGGTSDPQTGRWQHTWSLDVLQSTLAFSDLALWQAGVEKVDATDYYRVDLSNELMARLAARVDPASRRLILIAMVAASLLIALIVGFIGYRRNVRATRIEIV